MHIKLTNGQPETYTIGQLRRDNPQVSFPKNIPDSTLAEYNVFPVVLTDRPDGEVVEEATPALVNGKWTQQWTVRSMTAEELAAYKQQARESINAIRDQKETEGFEYNGKMFDSDERSADRILVAANAATASIFAQAPFSVTWRTKDNSDMVLDANGMLALNGALASLGVALHDQARGYKASIDAAQNKAAVDAVVWV